MIINLYLVQWDNGTNASGIFIDEVFTSKKSAERFGRWWKSGMVAIDEDHLDAKEAYQWEIVQCPFDVQRVFEWPGHSWHVFSDPPGPRSPIVKECPFRLVVPSLIQWLKQELKKPSSSYIRNRTITL